MTHQQAPSWAADRAAAATQKINARTQSTIQTAQAAAQVEIEKSRAAMEMAQQQRLAKIEAARVADQARAEKIRRAEDLAAEKNRARMDRKQARKRAREEARRAAMARARGVSQNLAGAAASVVYAIALAAATYGQISSATALDLPWGIGLAAAAFIEGAAIASALTAHRLRSAGRRAGLAQASTWLWTAAAVGIQYAGHAQPAGDGDAIMGWLFAAASLAAVLMFELRSHAVTELASKERPPVRWGWRRWLVAPISTARGWRVDVLTRTAPAARRVLAVADRTRTPRTRLTRRQRARVTDAAVAAYRTLAEAAAHGAVTSVRITVADTPTVSATATDITDATALALPIADTSADTSTDTSTDTTADTSADTTADTTADTWYVPSKWVRDNEKLVSAILSNLDDPAAAIAACETGRPDHDSENTTTADTTADTSTDTTADTSADTTADTTADTSTDTTADTTADTSTDTTANRRLRTPRKRVSRTRATKRDGEASAARRVDPDVIAAAAARLSEAGETVSARTLAAATGYGRTVCGHWLRDNR